MFSKFNFSRLGANFTNIFKWFLSKQSFKELLRRYMLLEEEEIAILPLCPGSLQKEGAGM